MKSKAKKRTLKISISLILMMIIGLSFFQITQAEQSVTVNAEIGAKLIFQAAPKKIKLNVDPVDKPTAKAGHKLMVKTNAPNYSITASYGAFEVGDYGLIENGNLTVASESPDSGEGTGGNFVEIGDEVEILAGESGYTNNEVTPVNYNLKVDFTVPFGEAGTTVVYTAAMST